MPANILTDTGRSFYSNGQRVAKTDTYVAMPSARNPTHQFYESRKPSTKSKLSQSRVRSFRRARCTVPLEAGASNRSIDSHRGAIGSAAKASSRRSADNCQPQALDRKK